MTGKQPTKGELMAMCIGSERWGDLPEDLQRRTVLLVRHTEEGMTTVRDQVTLLELLARFLDFCDGADVAEFVMTLPDYDDDEGDTRVWHD